MNKNLFRGFYFITDHYLSQNGNVEDVRLALSAGVKIVQFREKKREKQIFFQELIQIKKLCQDYKAYLIINDDIDLANEIEADGIHVGQDDALIEEVKLRVNNKMIIGVSTNSLPTALLAQDHGANYVGVGHIYPTTTKDKPNPPIGLDVLKEIKSHLKIPVVAIGGITLNNVKPVIESGADMVCAISDSIKGGTVKENIQSYKILFNI